METLCANAFKCKNANKKPNFIKLLDNTVSRNLYLRWNGNVKRRSGDFEWECDGPKSIDLCLSERILSLIDVGSSPVCR